MKRVAMMFTGLAMAMTVAGCAGKHPQPLVAGAELIQIGKGDVTGYQYLGEVTGVHGHGCGLFGYRGSYAGAVANLRNRAHAMGANYVQIMSQTQPFPAYNCFVNEYLIEATAYRIPSAGHAVTPASVPSSATPAASVAPQPSTSGAATQEQQLQELTRTPGLSYEEYQRRYRLIMGQ